MSEERRQETNPSPAPLPPPAYTPSQDNLPQYGDLPPKKVDLPPYNEESSYQNSPPEGTEGRRCILRQLELVSSAEELGTDSMFILCFLICFLFSWMGYIICCCLFASIAARFGAMSGIGLNFVKMLVIIRNYEFENTNMSCAKEYLRYHDIQYMLLISFGLMVMVLGIFRYNHLKTMLQRHLILPRYM